MPHWPLSELLYLVGVIAAFGAFGLTLLGVSLWVTLRAPEPKPVEREVTPAARVTSAH